MPRHLQSNEPTQVMHEDDPVILKFKNRILTRQNVKRVAWVFSVITLALLLFNEATLISLYESLQTERQDRIISTNEAICSLVDLVPPGNTRVDAVRDKYKCGPFIPDPGGPTSIATPPAARSVPSASTPSPTATVTATTTATATETATTRVQSTITQVIPQVSTITKTALISSTISIPLPVVTVTISCHLHIDPIC